MKYFLTAIVMLLAIPILCTAQETQPKNPYDLPDGLYAEITTPEGIVVCELFYKQTPLTVTNYVGLAEGTLGPKKGTPFFDGQPFGRVVPNFVVQGGTTVRPGFSYPDEFVPGLRHDSVGVLEMGNDGPDTNQSEMVLMLAPAQQLNYNHTVFGHTVRAVDSAGKAVRPEDFIPQIKLRDRMKVKILRLGDEAKAFKADQQAFDALLAKAKKYEGPLYPGPVAFLDDPDKVLGNPTAIRIRDFNTKLNNFHRFTNVRVVVRIFAKTPDDAQGDQQDGFLAALAEKMDAGKQGALVVYFLDKDQWIIRVGKDSVASFIAGPRKADGTKDPVAKDKTLDQAMREFMTVLNRNPRGGQTVAATAPAATTTSQPRPPRPAAQFDVLIDNLFYRLEPAAPKL